MHWVSQSYLSSPTSPHNALVLYLAGCFSLPKASLTLRQRWLSDSCLFHFAHNPPAWAMTRKGAARCSCWCHRYLWTSSHQLDAEPPFLDKCAPQVQGCRNRGDRGGPGRPTFWRRFLNFVWCFVTDVHHACGRMYNDECITKMGARFDYFTDRFRERTKATK